MVKTVLLIDDDAALRSLVTELLKDQGWNVLEAEDGEQGLRMALEEKPEVVICDLLMPRCNGFQFCRALNARRAALPRTKILVSSGSGYAVDRMNALESGADEYVTKPVEPRALIELIERLAAERPKPPRTSSAPFASEGPPRLKFWGVRGSIPAPGPCTAYYGGNTSCVEVRADGELIILDAGTGIRDLGKQLKREFGERPIRMTLLVSHTHWDHIQGFPFFAPAYDSRNELRVLAFEGPRKGLQATLAIQMESPYFPIAMQELPGNVRFEELKSLDFELGAVKVKAAFLNHPGVCAGYRLETSGGSIAYLPDNELFGRQRRSPAHQGSPQAEDFARQQDGRLREFIQGAEVVIADAQYSSEEYPAHIGWGHSCAEDVVDLAMEAGVRSLFLFHHDPGHTDEQIAQMLASAREQAARRGSALLIEAAREGCEVVLAPA